MDDKEQHILHEKEALLQILNSFQLDIDVCEVDTRDMMDQKKTDVRICQGSYDQNSPSLWMPNHGTFGLRSQSPVDSLLVSDNRKRSCILWPASAREEQFISKFRLHTDPPKVVPLLSGGNNNENHIDMGCNNVESFLSQCFASHDIKVVNTDQSLQL